VAVEHLLLALALVDTRRSLIRLQRGLTVLLLALAALERGEPEQTVETLLR
jgi:hypothetical protein